MINLLIHMSYLLLVNCKTENINLKRKKFLMKLFTL